MKLSAFGLIVLLSATSALSAQTGATPAADATDEIEKKIKILSDQIQELRKQQKPSAQQNADQKKRNEAEQRKQEEAEKKKHYVEVEIRGKLFKTGQPNPNPPNPYQAYAYHPYAWQVTVNELTWTLHFHDNKKLLAFVEKNAGKAVIVTGHVVTKKTPLPPIQPQWSHSWGGGDGGVDLHGNLLPRRPPTIYIVDTVIVNVTSMKLAED